MPTLWGRSWQDIFVHCSSKRHPFSKACLQHSQTVIQPCMWFLNDGTGSSMCCFAQGELTWLVMEPQTGLEDCLKILLSCFRARTSEQQSPRGDLGVIAERIADFAAAEAAGKLISSASCAWTIAVRTGTGAPPSCTRRLRRFTTLKKTIGHFWLEGRMQRFPDIDYHAIAVVEAKPMGTPVDVQGRAKELSPSLKIPASVLPGNLAHPCTANQPIWEKLQLNSLNLAPFLLLNPVVVNSFYLSWRCSKNGIWSWWHYWGMAKVSQYQDMLQYVLLNQ